jgi:hypothetical protein
VFAGTTPAFSTANPFSRPYLSTMGPKRASEDDLQQVTKVPKLEQDSPSSPQSQQNTQNADFSSSVKKRLANSTRTGQACDRCKVRATQAIATTRSPTRHCTQSQLSSNFLDSRRAGRAFPIAPLTLSADTQDTMRRQARWVLALRPESHRMQGKSYPSRISRNMPQVLLCLSLPKNWY